MTDNRYGYDQYLDRRFESGGVGDIRGGDPIPDDWFPYLNSFTDLGIVEQLNLLAKKWEEEDKLKEAQNSIVGNVLVENNH